MGNHNIKTETLNILNAWKDLIDRELIVMSEGRLDELQKIIQRTAFYQKGLEKIFSAHPHLSSDHDIKRALINLSDSQKAIAAELSLGSSKIKDILGELRKGRTSISGYRQQKSSSSRFFSKLT